MKDYLEKKQQRLRKFIRLSFGALIDTVNALGDEKKLLYVATFIKEQAPKCADSPRLLKDLLAIIPRVV